MSPATVMYNRIKWGLLLLVLCLFGCSSGNPARNWNYEDRSEYYEPETNYVFVPIYRSDDRPCLVKVLRELFVEQNEK